jgi:kumamolisin
MAFKPRPYIKQIKYPHADVIKTWGIKALVKAYSWPTALTGGGTIAIIELGGGWRPNDMATFFKAEGVPAPTITDISVDGTKNAPGQSDADGEVCLDIQVAAASYSFATGPLGIKAANIRIYWSQDIASAVRAATKDGCDVCSISWGDAEGVWGRPAVEDMQAAALAATTAGMIVFAASGDNDADDDTATPAVDCPACCPNIIGCGGTRLLDDGTLRGPESVWNDDPGQASGEGTGGGYSTFFTPMPLWQAGAPHGPGRMVPDLAANADPVTGYHIYLDGQWQVVGGTSAVAPLYAGLFASFGKKLGFVTPKLFLNHLAFNDITVGNNGQFRAGIGPDPCTGLGSPIGTKLAALFKAP